MTSPIADGVMAATHKLVQQAMCGQWQEVPKTVEQRRVLLEQLTATASPQDQQWLAALQQAMAESDAAVAKIAQAGASSTALPPMTGEGQNNNSATGVVTASTTGEVDLVGSTLDMIRGR
jgi:hypothetical protein